MQDQETRRGFWAVLWATIAGAFSGSSLHAATQVKLDQIKGVSPGPALVGYNTDLRGVRVTVGSGLMLSGGVLSAVSTPVTSTRNYGVRLSVGVDGTYPILDGVRIRTVVYRNGFRQFPGEDYTIANNIITPVVAYPWASDDSVQADGE